VTTKKFFLFFPKCETEKPIIYHLVKDFSLIINVFRAKVTPDEEGYMVLDVTGEDANIQKGIEFLESFGVRVDPFNKGLRWDETRCTHCGNCLTHCPTHALKIADRKTMRVCFTEELCIECLACIRNCPFGACTSAF
jgi:ferredoxin